MKQALASNYAKLKSSEIQDGWELTCPAIISKVNKTNRFSNPFIGVVPRSNLYSAVLDSYCKQCNSTIEKRFGGTVGKPRSVLAFSFEPQDPNLTRLLKKICAPSTGADVEAEIEYSSCVATHKALFTSPASHELLTFILNLSSFLNGCYSQRTICIEPFQKQLILHTFFFLVSIKCPESTNELFTAFQEYFGLFRADYETLQIFKQKSSVFLIPRRHGKTWIVVAIISMILTSVENIHIGYVAHQKHVATSVFTEIINTLYKYFPTQYIDVKKEHGTIIYRSKSKKPSTLMCATCFNKNVSMPS